MVLGLCLEGVEALQNLETVDLHGVRITDPSIWDTLAKIANLR